LLALAIEVYSSAVFERPRIAAIGILDQIGKVARRRGKRVRPSVKL
jgi:hypothetical protein